MNKRHSTDGGRDVNGAKPVINSHNKLMLTFILICLTCLIIFAGCGSTLTEDVTDGGNEFKKERSSLERDVYPDVSEADIDSIVAGNTDFALALYQQLRAGESGNLFFSPYSISTALVMLYGGAVADTATQMAATLNFTLPPETLHSGFNYLALELDSRGEGADGADGGVFRLNIANAVFTILARRKLGLGNYRNNRAGN